MSHSFTVQSVFDYNPLLSFLEAESLFNKIQSSIPPEISYIYPNLVSDILEEAEDPFILSLDYYQALLSQQPNAKRSTVMAWVSKGVEL